MALIGNHGFEYHGGKMKQMTRMAKKDVWRVALRTLALLGMRGLTATAAQAAPATVYAHVMGEQTPLFIQGSAAKRPIASLTKMTTALVVRQHLGLWEKVAVPKDFKIPMGSKAGVRPQGLYTVYELLAGLLVQSGNDASHALAGALRQKGIDPVAAMNKKAQELGLTNTRYGNLSGLDCPGCGSTARDQTVILYNVRKDPVLWWLMSRRGRLALPFFGPEGPRELVGRLGKFPLPDTFNGGKTGFTRGAQDCLAGTFTLGGREVLFVMLGSDNLKKGLPWLGKKFAQLMGVEVAQSLSVKPQ